MSNRHRSFGYRTVVLSMALIVSLLSARNSVGSPTSSAPQRPPQSTFHVEDAESLPYFPSMNSVMEPAPELLDQLATEFAPIAEMQKVDPTVYWLAFHFWLADKFNGMAMEDGFNHGVSLKQARWLNYATCYWGGVEERKNYAQPLPLTYRVILAVLNFFKSEESSVSHIVAALQAMDKALAGNLANKTDEISARLHTAPPGPYGKIIGSMIFSTAYDTFYMVTVGEAPPVGERRPHLKAFKPNLVVADPKVFMQVQYADPIPVWLGDVRATYEEAKTKHPAEFEKLLVGSASGDIAQGPNDLRTLWAEGLPTAHTNWGGDKLDPWTQPQYDANMRGNARWNMGLEAISMAAMSAVLNKDAAMADKALQGNSLFIAAWNAFANGFTAPASVQAALPKVSRN